MQRLRPEFLLAAAGLTGMAWNGKIERMASEASFEMEKLLWELEKVRAELRHLEEREDPARLGVHRAYLSYQVREAKLERTLQRYETWRYYPFTRKLFSPPPTLSFKFY